MTPFEIVTFDCYGTLIDWESGISEAFAKASAAAGVEIDAARAVRLHAEVEPTLEAGPWRPYREVLTISAVEVARRLGWTLSREDARFLPDSLPEWRPFPDTRPSLARLAGAGCRLGILSNVDDDLLARTIARVEAPFELVVTAERVRSYKPAPAHFLEARQRVGAAKWLHAAQSHFHDVTPARSLEIPVAWINRKREVAVGARPDRELPDLAALADWLAPA